MMFVRTKQENGDCTENSTRVTVIVALLFRLH